jgi:hypothetical protein
VAPPPAPHEIPTFTEEPEEIPQQPGIVTSQAVEDSLVLDETIIDELIDDISMTGSVVADLPTSVTEKRPVGSPPPEYMAAPSQAPRPVPRDPASRPALAPVSSTTTVLERLSSGRREVEISLLGSNTTINGILVWSENGLIGVESGGALYTIPLSSVSFIKSAVP